MKLIRSLFFTRFLYTLIAADVLLFICAFFLPSAYKLAWAFFWTLIALTAFDAVLLFALPKGMLGFRKTMRKLSNGDNNEIQLLLVNQYAFDVYIEVMDELPFQFQRRDFLIYSKLKSGERKNFCYSLRPVERGEYHFGAMNVMCSSFFRLVKRRYCFDENRMLPVYPSFIQMRKYELLAISNRLTMSGIKKIRRVGNTTEFDQLKEYIPGDDVRTINWKATARRQKLMVNKYQDERAQQVYSLIDMGRIMRMPFEGMTLLDYAINASLVISNIAWVKQDKPGLLAFNHRVQHFLPAERKGSQMFRIQESLYNLKTNFLETDYERLYGYVKTHIPQRSLFLVFSNFETLNGLKRQIRYIRRIARQHLVVIIFFENTELRKLLDAPAKNTKEIYDKTIAEKFEFEKKLIQRELHAYGVQSIYTTPERLSVNVINKYLELKSRGSI